MSNLFVKRQVTTSVAVRSYKRTSGEQMRQVTDMLYGNKSEKRVKVEVPCTMSAPLKDTSKAEESKPEIVSEKVETKAVGLDCEKNLI